MRLQIYMGMEQHERHDTHVQRLAAVVKPYTWSPDLYMVPAPRKPMPLTIWAATRLVS
jgi:hypothetical protein